VSLLCVGSVALDTVRTPHGCMTDVLGGSAVYATMAARFFTDVRLVGVVGRDFPPEHIEMLRANGVDTRGLVVTEGDTFRWSGAYEGTMNEAETLDVQLNVFAEFDPEIPPEYADTECVFLGNGSPRMQLSVRRQLPRAGIVACDTMNYWIENDREGLEELLGEVHGVVLNDAEARTFTGLMNLPAAARAVLDYGPQFVVVKKGEHGSLCATSDGFAVLPAYPATSVVDPTGAGDSFAGGMMGYLAGVDALTGDELRRGLVYGTVMASINIEGFSLQRLAEVTRDSIDARRAELEAAVRFS